MAFREVPKDFEKKPAEQPGRLASGSLADPEGAVHPALRVPRQARHQEGQHEQDDADGDDDGDGH